MITECQCTRAQRPPAVLACTPIARASKVRTTLPVPMTTLQVTNNAASANSMTEQRDLLCRKLTRRADLLHLRSPKPPPPSTPVRHFLSHARPHLLTRHLSMYDVLILGGGPAGLQATLSVSRHFRTVALIYADPASLPFRNAAASHMHNVLGNDHTPAEDYRRAARAQLVGRYSETLRIFDQSRITAASKVDKSHEGLPTAFQVQDEHGQTWLGRKLILATGCQDEMPEAISGFKEAWGKAM